MRWKLDLGTKIMGGANRLGDLVIAGSYSHDLVACGLKDGGERWRFTADAQIHAAPTVVQGNVLIAGCDGQLRIIDGATGRQLRAAELGTNAGATAAARDGIALVATLGGTWNAIALADATVRWKGGIDGHRFLASPAWSAGGALLFSQEGALVCLDGATGAQRWRRDLPEGGEASPIIAGDAAVVACEDGLVQLVALTDGKERWRFNAGAGITASPALADGRLVVAVADGAVYGFTGTAP